MALGNILELIKWELCGLLRGYKMDTKERLLGKKSLFIISSDASLQRNGG